MEIARTFGFVSESSGVTAHTIAQIDTHMDGSAGRL